MTFLLPCRGNSGDEYCLLSEVHHISFIEFTSIVVKTGMKFNVFDAHIPPKAPKLRNVKITFLYSSLDSNHYELNFSFNDYE